ncbi:MAG: restriction endonuclease subunit S [Anaerolineales bacterium]
MEAIIDYRGKTPRKSSFGIPLITAKIVKSGRILEPTEFIPYEDYDERMQRGIPNAGDIVVTTEAPLGEVGQLDNRKLSVGQRLITLRGKRNLVDNNYLKFLMMSEFVQNQLRARATRTTVIGIKQTELRKIDLVIPPLPEQRAIAGILGALDDKIEVNRRMNATLEYMARAVFREMMKYEKVEEKTIGDIVTIVGGSTPSTRNPEFWENGNINWATPKDLAPLQSPILLDTNSRITEMGLQKISSGLLPVGTVLLSSRAPIGYLAITQIPVAINQGFIAIKCTGEAPNYFILNWLKENMEEVIGRANGTTFLEINKANFRPMKINVPPPEKIKAFIDSIEPFYQKIIANLNESRTLASLRDSLLPKLMRGEVRVRDVEIK